MALRSLDDASVLAAADPSGMLRALDTYVNGFVASLGVAQRLPLKAPRPFSNFVVAGMGGSGIAGTLVATLLVPEARVPVAVVKDYTLPAFVGRGSVVVAVSYSGNTEETLAAARQALERGATLVSVASGGGLADLAQATQTARVMVPSGLQPRAALNHLFGSVLGVGHALGLTGARFHGAGERHVRGVHSALRPGHPEAQNAAKQWARALHDKFPVWYASGPHAAVALRARGQLNENAKMLAREDVVPEANHNELVAWNAVTDGSKYFVGFLRDAHEPVQVGRRFGFVADVLKRRRVAHAERRLTGPTPLARLLEALLFVDYVSVYAAFLRGVDPGDVSIIVDLKRVLGEGGAARPVSRRRR